MAHEPVLILGCGYTGRRVAAKLVGRGATVFATTRRRQGLPGVVFVDNLKSVPEGALVLWSVPPVDDEERLLERLGARPRRVVYLSSTGVYGAQREVDEATPPAPETERQRRRFASEERIGAGPWETLVLRPAAIYGPHRGVHAALRAGRYRLVGDGSNVGSRIHVEDLAVHCVAALSAGLAGAFPVADAEPVRAKEIAEFCAGLLGIDPPGSYAPGTEPELLRVTRRVDGRAVRRLLGVRLAYPSFRSGIPAALAEEASSA